MALTQFLRRALEIALGDRASAKELADAVDATTAGAVTLAGNAEAITGSKVFSGTNTHSGAETFTGGVTVATAGVTITDVNVALSATTGTQIGTAITQKLAFFGSTPIVQRASANQAVAVAASGGDSPTEAEFNAVVTLVNELRTALINFGLIKGAA